MNKVILMGNVGRDPEMKMAEGVPVARFSLATTENRSVRNADGTFTSLPPITEWHRIVMAGRAAEFAEKYIRKGSRLLLEGKLRTSQWDDQYGIKHSKTEIYVDSFEILPKGSQQ